MGVVGGGRRFSSLLWFWVVFPVLFVALSRFRGFVRGWFRFGWVLGLFGVAFGVSAWRSAPFVSLFFFGSFALCWLSLLVWRLLAVAFFVRFPRPRRRPFGAPRPFRGAVPFGRWVCVPLAALPSVRASWFVWGVRPAVVRRRLGVVCAVWVWCSAPLGAAEAAPEGR